MTACPDSECKAEFSAMKENLYGKGPEGGGGVYGVLRTKVSWKAFGVLFTVAIMMVGWVMLHESRISKAETILSTICKDVDALKVQNFQSTQKILNAIEELKK